MAQDLHLSGTTGNAAAADAEQGSDATDRAAQALITLVREVQKSNLDFLKVKLPSKEGLSRR
ncbi:hypothetical protein LZ023_38745 (plasmid) [Pseudomonas silvicola]|nr:hypothetical protein LZ023_38745 [Pseudomonas silvicola]